MPEAVEPFGFLNIDKPLHMTSHDVVARVRRVFGTRRVGHAGTLDPLATGVLVVCVGRATRLSEYAMAHTKTYQAHVQLGQSTTTYDAEGEVVSEQDATHITAGAIAAILPEFMGEIDQLPPIYSAIKQQGKKLYELARAGKQIERQPRRVLIHQLTMGDFNPDTMTFSLFVTCGSGTYIRSLAHDIGERLGVGGYLAGLVRTGSGAFRLDDAVSLETLTQADNPVPYLMSVEQALIGYPVVHLSNSEVEQVEFGQQIGETDHADGEVALSYATDGTFIAVLRAANGRWKPHKVFSITP